MAKQLNRQWRKRSADELREIALRLDPELANDPKALEEQLRVDLAYEDSIALRYGDVREKDDVS